MKIFENIFGGKGKRATGRSGEDSARHFLEEKGYRFVAANYRVRRGEVDLVMKNKDTIVFVEVKARRAANFGQPEEFVTLKKQRRIIVAAVDFVKARGLAGSPLRFDVVGIQPEGIKHLENAFSVSEGYTL